jgi:hypothetical protein
MYNEGIRTFLAGEDLEARRRVKIKSATTTTPPEVVYADAGEDYIGVTEYAVESGDPIACRLNTYPGTLEIECVVDSEIARARCSTVPMTARYPMQLRVPPRDRARGWRGQSAYRGGGMERKIHHGSHRLRRRLRLAYNRNDR